MSKYELEKKFKRIVQGRHQSLGDDSVFPKLLHKPLVFDLLVGGMLVYDQQLILIRDQPVCVEDLPDQRKLRWNSAAASMPSGVFPWICTATGAKTFFRKYWMNDQPVCVEDLPDQRKLRSCRFRQYFVRKQLHLDGRYNRNLILTVLAGFLLRNGRHIISKAVEEGYREYLMQHKFPFCVLHFQIDTKRIDVNVHPTKMEVRIADGPASV